MKEFKLENNNPVSSITNQLWSLFDILRTEVTSNEYNLVLFLMSIYKDGYLENIQNIDQYDIKALIENRLKDSSFVYHDDYYEIYQSFEHSFRRLSERGLFHIFQILLAVDFRLFKENFPDIFDSMLYRIAQSQGRFGGEFMQPIELTRLVYNLAELPTNASVFNPFAGVASFGVMLDNGQAYFGQELNYATWAVGTLRILAYERSAFSKYVKDDSILHWPNEDQKFDLVVSNPPYGLKLNNNYREIFPEYRTAEQLLIERGISSLTKEGKLIAILPNGFLFRGGSEQRLREYLIETDLIDSIISLPGGLLLNTGMPIVILILDKSKRKPGLVKFIDAKNYIDSSGLREKRLNDYALFSFIKKDIDSDSGKTVSLDQIREFRYNLSLPKYFQREINGTRLREALEYIRPKSANGIHNGRVVKISNLREDSLAPYLVSSEIEVTEVKTKGFRLIDENCLLLSNKWKNLKPTIFQFDGDPILITADIIAFRINRDKINELYLTNELDAEYVKEQLNSSSIGSSIPFIKVNDLLEIKIFLPSLKEQIAKVQGLQELSGKIRTLQQERNMLAHDNTNSRFNEFASLKHTLGRPRQNILDWSDNLLHFFGEKKTEIEKLNNSFAGFYNIDILSALHEIKSDINFMSDILEKGENGLIVSDYPLRVVSLSDINSLINVITDNGFKFKIKKLLLKGDKLKERGIECNPTLLRTLIDNVLTNANKHGYTKKDVSNELVIELTEVEDSLILEIRNNGKPFSNNMDKEKFISKYTTASPEVGNGLGGYDINRIAVYFNDSSWELILNDDPIYPVKFKFHFSIKFVK